MVVVGCGTPKFSMGWTHLYQLQAPPLSAIADVVGVVEPYLLSDQGKSAPGAAAFAEYVADHPHLKFVSSCKELPPVRPAKARVGIIAVRTPAARSSFETAVLEAGCTAIYLEKPGAGSTADLDAMMQLAKEKGVTVMVGYSRNIGTHAHGLWNTLRQILPLLAIGVWPR